MFIAPKPDRRNTQPLSGSNPFQFALSDLLIITIIMGALMTAWRNADQDSFFPPGVVVISLFGALLMYSMLLAARHGYEYRLTRWAYVIGSMMIVSAVLFGGLSLLWLFVAFSQSIQELKGGHSDVLYFIRHSNHGIRFAQMGVASTEEIFVETMKILIVGMVLAWDENVKHDHFAPKTNGLDGIRFLRRNLVPHGIAAG